MNDEERAEIQKMVRREVAEQMAYHVRDDHKPGRRT